MWQVHLLIRALANRIIADSGIWPTAHQDRSFSRYDYQRYQEIKVSVKVTRLFTGNGDRGIHMFFHMKYPFGKRQPKVWNIAKPKNIQRALNG